MSRLTSPKLLSKDSLRIKLIATCSSRGDSSRDKFITGFEMVFTAYFCLVRITVAN